MYKKDRDSYIYVQSDYSLDSDFNKTPCNDLKDRSSYSFDRSTPQLQYSGSIKSFQNKRFLDTNHSTPSVYNCRIEEGSSIPISNTDRNRRLFLDIGEDKFYRERSYNIPTTSRTIRSSTCNVRIPCELDNNDTEKRPILNHKINNPNFYRSNSVHKNRSNLNRTLDYRYNIDISNSNNYNFLKNKDYKSNKINKNNIDNIDRNNTINNRIKLRDILDLESQNTMNDTEDTHTDLDEFMEKSGRDLLLAPEFASDEKTRKFLSLGREVFMAVVGCQVVYILASLLFGNVALAIIVFLLLVQSCFCHCDGRPLAYFINALLSFSIAVTVVVALAKEVSGLEPFRTEPVLKTLSYVYIPLCLVFTALSLFLAFGYRSLFRSEKKAIVNATNNLLGSEYYVDNKTMAIKKH